MRIRVAQSAKDDLRRSSRFYDNQAAGQGKKFTEHFRRTAARLRFSGGMHEQVEGLFRCLMDPYPFAIFYVTQTDLIVVLAIKDCRAHPEGIERGIRQAKRDFESERDT